MKLTNNLIYVIFGVLITIYFINLYRQKSETNTENFVEYIDPKVLTQGYRKASSGYICNKPMDGTSDDGEEGTNIGKFCKKYPSPESIFDLSTIIIPAITKINKKNIKVLSTKDLRVGKESNGTFTEHKGKGYPSSLGEPLREMDLMKDEAMQMCLNDELCDAIVTPNLKAGDKMGYSEFHGPKPVGSLVNNPDFDSYVKNYTYEYSMVFWIKITKENGGWRGIFHHGNTNKSRFPSLWIVPNSLSLLFAISTTAADTKTWGESLTFGGLTLNKWGFVGLSLKGREVKVFVDGKQSGSMTLRGDVLWPNDKQKVTISGWGNTGDFELSKMSWVPMTLPDQMLESMAYSTFPTKSFEPENSLVPMDIPATISYSNGWEQSGESSVTLKKIQNIAFLDGYISNTKPIKKYSTIGSVPYDYRPDRDCVFSVPVKGGFLSLIVEKGGNIILTNTRKYAYVANSPVSLSNVRYPILSGNVAITGGPSTVKGRADFVGGIVFLSGSGKSDLAVGKLRASPPHPTMNIGTINNGTLGQVFVTTSGAIEQVGENKKQNTLSYEGISFPLYNGEVLKLQNNWRPQGEDTPVSVLMNNNIVKLSGIVIKYYRANYKLNNPNKNLGCYADSNDMEDSESGRGTIESCTYEAVKKGHQFVGIGDGGKICKTGNFYGTKGISENCSVGCKNTPEFICGSKDGSGLTIYDASVKPETICTLPKNFCPSNTLTFLCATADRGSSARLQILKTGEIQWLGTDNGLFANNAISLCDITFTVAEKGGIVGWEEISKPGANLQCNSGPGTGYTPTGSVDNLEECKTRCHNKKDCNYINYMPGYSPKSCDLFSKCNLVSPGPAYYYGDHNVWKMNKFNDDGTPDEDIAHWVDSCNQCGRNDWCESSSWFKNEPDAEKFYLLGDPVSKWGCDKAKNVTKVIRNSRTGAIYAIESKDNNVTPADGITQVDGITPVDGWINGDVISSGKFPSCNTECEKNTDCEGTRWIKSNGDCNLLKNIDPKSKNDDSRWGHVFF